MAIYEHLVQFAGLPVKDFDPKRGIEDPSGTCYRVSPHDQDADAPGAPVPTTWGSRLGKLLGGKSPEPPPPRDAPATALATFLADPAASQVTALVIGMWNFDRGAADDAEGVVRRLVEGKDRLSSLRALFFADIIVDECEISWINQTDLAPLLAAFPRLEELWVRGSEGLSLGWKLRHDSLKTLVVQCGGLDGAVAQQIASAHLPMLEHLELWLGEENYGNTTTLADLQPILSGASFPRLRYLGLRNAENSDELAHALSEAPVVARLQELDLSLGTLSDEGARHLLSSSAVRQLRKLDLHHHFLSAAMSLRVQELNIEVDVSDPQTAEDIGADEDYRFIAHGE